MLCLSRQTGERLVIADNIILTVLSADRGRVRLGIVAPESVRVEREEVRARREAEAYRELGGEGG